MSPESLKERFEKTKGQALSVRSTVAQDVNEIATTMEKVLMDGDLSRLSAVERLNYYQKVCESTGLNPFTRPFDYIKLNNKLTLYAKKDATDQLRKINTVSLNIVGKDFMEDLFMVTVQAVDVVGRKDEDVGAVCVKGLAGNDLANAMMKAVTKAKRRVTLSISGLGLLDESEIETIPDAKFVVMEDSLPKVEIMGEMPKVETPVEKKSEPKENPKQVEVIVGEVVDDPMNNPFAGMDVVKEPGNVPVNPPAQNQGNQVHDKRLISDKQAKRMYALAHGDPDIVRKALDEYGYEKSSSVSMDDYEAVCDEIKGMAGN